MKKRRGNDVADRPHAAEAAHVTQPTLSAGIQELERTLGAPVVDRDFKDMLTSYTFCAAIRMLTLHTSR